MKARLQHALQDKDFSELFKKGGVSFLMRVLGQAAGLLLTLIIARYFGAEGLGEYMLAIVVLRIFVLFAKLGLDTASIRFIASLAKQRKWDSLLDFRRKVLSLLFITSFLASILMYFFSGSIAVLLNTASENIKYFSFFVLPLSFFILNYQSLRGLKKIISYSFFYKLNQSFFTIVAIIILLQFSSSSSLPIKAYSFSIVMGVILSFILFNRSLKQKLGKSITEKISYSDILTVSIPLMFAQTVQFIMAWVDKLMLGNMMSPEDVGVYGVAFRLSMFASITLMAVNSIASPKFAELYAENNIDGLKKVAQQSTKMIFWTTLPLVFIFFLFPSFFLGMFGEEFKSGVGAFIILSIGMLISAFSGSVGNLLQMTGQQNIFFKILFLGACVNIVLNLLLIPNDNLFAGLGISGINGAASASMLSIMFWKVSMVIMVKRRLGFSTIYIPFFRSKR